MAKKPTDKTPSGPQLDILTAQKVFGWRNVHQHEGGELMGKKPDKLRRWRTARVPRYSSNPVHAYAIDERMKQLGRAEKYLKELSRITRANRVPSEWAMPEQRARAGLKALGN